MSKKLSASNLLSNRLLSSKTIGIIMLNMGGPSSLDQVPLFLNNLFNDRDLLHLPMQKHMAKFITKMRTPKIQKQYKEIGGKSPIFQLTQNQLEEILARLNEKAGDNAYKGYIGFRYVPPYVNDAIEQCFKECDEIVLFNQYMQYSCSTSGSSFIEAYRSIKKIYSEKNMTKKKIYAIDRWHIYPPFISAYSQLIEKCIKDNKINVDQSILLFSAHSVPITNILRGDTYAYEVASSVESVMRILNSQENYQGRIRYKLVWQSKVGPKQWLEPHTDETIETLGKRAEYKNVIIVPITFTTDHIETLYELDIELKHMTHENKMNYYRVEALNNNEVFIQGMVDLVQKHLQNKEYTNPKMFVRCKGCINPNCKESKDFFLKNLA